MIAKLVVGGKEFDIDILDPELQKLIKPQKKTGYELCEPGQSYYIDGDLGFTEMFDGAVGGLAQEQYKSANYYSDETVAKNNVRADKLMRQLRRFAVEHRKSKIEWNKTYYKYYIRFGHYNKELFVETEMLGHSFGMIVFDSKEAAELAIDAFYDELMWYFTEYKDSL